MNVKPIGTVVGHVAQALADPSLRNVAIGNKVKLHWDTVERETLNPRFIEHQRNVVGVVTKLWQPLGFPPHVCVDFGSSGEWSGPIIFLQSAYEDA